MILPIYKNRPIFETMVERQYTRVFFWSRQWLLLCCGRFIINAILKHSLRKRKRENQLSFVVNFKLVILESWRRRREGFVLGGSVRECYIWEVESSSQWIWYCPFHCASSYAGLRACFFGFWVWYLLPYRWFSFGLSQWSDFTFQGKACNGNW